MKLSSKESIPHGKELTFKVFLANSHEAVTGILRHELVGVRTGGRRDLQEAGGVVYAWHSLGAVLHLDEWTSPETQVTTRPACTGDWVLWRDEVGADCTGLSQLFRLLAAHGCQSLFSHYTAATCPTEPIFAPLGTKLTCARSALEDMERLAAPDAVSYASCDYASLLLVCDACC